MTTSSAHPTNTAAVLTAVGELHLETRSIPEPGPRDVLVRVEAVGICGSDAHYYRHGRIGSYVVDAPLVLGHETAGTVAKVGAEVRDLSVGDRVAVEPGVPCGRCELCRSGHYNLCEHVVFHATPPVDGTLQRFAVIPEDFAFKLPDQVSTEQGALVEPLAVAVWACRKAGVAPGARVLVTGAGPVGLLAVQVAKAFGASHVTTTDLDHSKLDIARSLGADRAVPADQFDDEPSGLYDVHLECSGSSVAATHGIRRLTRLGTSVLVGMGADEIALPVSAIQERELRITGIFRYANCYPLAIDLLASGRVRVDELITGRFPLSESAAAISGSGAPGTLKNVVLPGVG